MERERMTHVTTTLDPEEVAELDSFRRQFTPTKSRSEIMRLMIRYVMKNYSESFVAEVEVE